MNALIDTDALLGLFNPQDIHHQTAVSLAEKIFATGTNIFILPTTLSEFSLLASSKIGFSQTQRAVSHIVSSDFLTIEIDEEITSKAVTLYQKQTSKEESLFDCFVMVCAKKISAAYIFSFDQGYRKNGFHLASDILG